MKSRFILLAAAAVFPMIALASNPGSSNAQIQMFGHIDAQADISLMQASSGDLAESCNTIKQLQSDLQGESAAIPAQINHDLKAVLSSCSRQSSDKSGAALDIIEALNSIDATASLNARALQVSDQFGM